MHRGAGCLSGRLGYDEITIECADSDTIKHTYKLNFGCDCCRTCSLISNVIKISIAVVVRHQEHIVIIIVHRD